MYGKFKFIAAGLLFAFLSKTLIAEEWITIEDGGRAVINIRDYIDSSALDPSSVYVASSAANGSVFAVDGVVTYTHHGGGASDSFTYRIADYNATYRAPVTVNISIGRSPVASDVVTVAPGGTTVVKLITDFSRLDPFSISVNAAQNGSLDKPYAGAIRYTHRAGAGWEDEIKFSVADYNAIYLNPQSIRVRVSADTPMTHYQELQGWQSNLGLGGNSGATNTVSTNQVGTGGSAVTGSQGWWQPGAYDNLKWQLQLQGDVRIISGAKVYAVDVTASQASIDAAKATGAKMKCYISAGSAENWRSDYYNIPSHVIGNSYDGWPGEWWLNTRDINALAPVMRARLDECVRKGFDAIDADNVNGFENNTGFNLSRQDSINYIRWLANESHARGLAFSLKNSETLIDDVIDSVDMLQSESCVIYNNCYNASKMTARNKPVFAVEYSNRMDTTRFWNEACPTARNYNFSMIYRDLALTPYGVYQSCQ